ncbi:aminotransferase class V-fold PLP-dependent enzyme [Chamaesiphon sp. OTE_20_metabat_361]|uniref:aminotransferase class V-fold PLP-dependent enzyme n=1 Tax=Chamaesiphon sp. OTE_20_metabat_361 TaxID=2964689 RepID=UPI00286A43BF|nr:aminotransferase class V-fold PLP-dependent enzyme [Chamaesiphon sp. OTE_20_metabat_361]
MPMNYRQQFPALANKAYFNYGGQGPMPQAALGAIVAAYERIQTQGPFGFKTSELVGRESNLTRQAIASELGVTAESIALTENVTAGCNIALWGLNWQPGDRILISDCEHPGVIASIKEICRRFQVEIDVFPLMATLDNGDPVTVVTAHLQPQTRLVVLSHVLWNTGQVLPLAEIAAGIRQYSPGNRSIRILVDAAQSVGLLPLNLAQLGIDFYAFTGHKWWCGPEGVGGLYIHPDALASLDPTFIGWRSLDYSNSDLPLVRDARRYEVATSAYPLYAGLRAAIATHQSWGSAADRASKIVSLATYLWENLQQVAGISCLNQTAPQSGLVSFQVRSADRAKLVKDLEDRHFYLRTIVDPACIRACTHYFTTTTEIDELIQCLRKLIS